MTSAKTPQEKLKKNLSESLPDAPGIYKMKDAEARVIYIGKAKNLRHRVLHYFQKDYIHSTRTRKLMEQISDVDFTQTDTELEALLLENNIVKELRPKYNILMKDDKSYVYIKINLEEDYPRIRVVREREMEKRGPPQSRAEQGTLLTLPTRRQAATRHTGDKEEKALYFGPKLATSKVYESLRVLKKLFPFRHCNLDIKWKGRPGVASVEPSRIAGGTAMDIGGQGQGHENLPLSPNKELVEVTNRVIDFPCLDYFIKRCPGPCIGAISPKPYKKIVQQVVDFLKGKTEDLEKSLKEEMQEAASKKLFEKAARIRDKLLAIESITEHQKITNLSRHDTDIINFTAEMGHVYFSVLMIRRGKLLAQENFALDALGMPSAEALAELSEVLNAFLTQYYEKAADIPKEILIPEISGEIFEEKQTLELWLSEKRGDHVKLITPQKGEKNKLLELALKNAVSFAKQSRIRFMAEAQGETALSRLAEVLRMKNLKRIEGFDISHLSGNETVGSMVVFENGKPKREHYRHFKMRTVSGKPDDYRSMEEVLMRRLKYLQKNESLRIAKARKKDSTLIKSWGTAVKWSELMKNPDWQNFYLLFHKKKPVGMARLIAVKENIFMIEAVYVIPEYRGGLLSYTFMQKLIARIKNKKVRLYISVEDHLLNHWMTFGFVRVHTAPDEVMKRNTFFEKLDNTRYTVLAYYPGQKKKIDPSFSATPDLLVIDGGKGQLSTALFVLKRLNQGIPAISLAKRLEEIYLPEEAAPLLLSEGDEALKLLQRIRDESHRFAITFQRELHRKNIMESERLSHRP